jgi:hypothetical protein
MATVIADDDVKAGGFLALRAESRSFVDCSVKTSRFRTVEL